MNRVERVRAALDREEVDRVPISIWHHYPAVDQDPKTLAETTAEYTAKYDFDFIKMMPFGLYNVQDWGCQVKFFCTEDKYPIAIKTPIKSPKDYNKINVLPANYGTLGKQVQFTRYLQEIVGNEIPYIQTIFSPLSTLAKLAGRRIYNDLYECPNEIHKALEAITQTTINFIDENKKLGVSGFFFAVQQACYDVRTRIPDTKPVQFHHDTMSWDDYRKFGKPYDLMVLEAATAGTWFNVLHIHGLKTMFNELLDYPVQAINWHDRKAYPSLSEARGLTDKCLIGGMADLASGARETVMEGTSEEVTDEIRDAIVQAGKRGLMIGPGCISNPCAPERNIIAARRAVELF